MSLSQADCQLGGFASVIVVIRKAIVQFETTFAGTPPKMKLVLQGMPSLI